MLRAVQPNTSSGLHSPHIFAQNQQAHNASRTKGKGEDCRTRENPSRCPSYIPPPMKLHYHLVTFKQAQREKATKQRDQLLHMYYSTMLKDPDINNGHLLLGSRHTTPSHKCPRSTTMGQDPSAIIFSNNNQSDG